MDREETGAVRALIDASARVTAIPAAAAAGLGNFYRFSDAACAWWSESVATDYPPCIQTSGNF